MRAHCMTLRDLREAVAALPSELDTVAIHVSGWIGGYDVADDESPDGRVVGLSVKNAEIIVEIE